MGYLKVIYIDGFGDNGVWPQITVGINIAKRPIMISTVQVNPPVE